MGISPLPRLWNVHDPACPTDAVLIDRSTDWGNPFRIGPRRTRAEAIALFKSWVWFPQQDELRARAKRELRGKDLKCYCPPKDCHGRIWREIANS